MTGKSASTSVDYILDSLTHSTFLGEAKFNLTYWNCANISNKGLPTRSNIQKCSLEEQLFITLLRLRRGFNLVTLAHLYVCEFTIRKIFTTWLMFMFHHFKDHEVLMFPERNAFNKRFVPKVFRKFKNIRCTEFFCEMPRDYGHQGNTYSSCQHHCTMKC